MILKKLFSLILIFIFGLLSILAQEKPKPYQFDLDKANAAFLNKKYNTAAQFFQKVYPKVKNQEEKQQILFYIAESYRKSNNFKQAIKWYEEVLNARYPDPKVIYSYGLLLKNFERYDEAARAFYDYLFEVPDDKEAKREYQSCNIAAEWKNNPQKYNVVNVKDVNTEFSDYSPWLSGNTLYFTTSRKETLGKEIFEWTGQKYSDIFESSLNGNSFTKPEGIKGKINTPFNEGVACIDEQQTTMFYTQCNGIDGKGVSCKIYVSYKQNGEWTEGKPLPFNSDSFSCGHPVLNSNGNRLFFASDMPGGFGEKDIWYVSYNAAKDQFGTPINCGPNVNTTQDEMFPFTDENNKLFFASKGHIGMGGFDIYVSGDSANTFKKAVNLKYPINSGGDDFGYFGISSNKILPNGTIAYITSNREGGIGDDDIYAISIKPFVFFVKGFVLERESMQPIAQASINATVINGKQVSSLKTSDKGTFSIELPLNEMIDLVASKNKFFTGSPIQVNTNNIKKDTTLNITIFLDPIPNEDIEITLEGIYYDLDKWDLRPQSKVVLDSLVKILNANPGIVIELASHTDSRASADYNLTLSKKRAQSCVDYLVQKGIEKKRLQPVGYGESKLINDCVDGVDCSEEEHQQNRRTTFRVLKTDFKK
ncbi:MAG: OmpA family protein [Bacteroidia bacterium]